MNIMPHSRAKVRIETENDVIAFINGLCDGRTDFYAIENEDCSKRVNARSLLGMLYAMSEFPTEMFLVNETHGGYIPPANYRFLAD